MVVIIPSRRFKKSVKHLNQDKRTRLEKIIRKIILKPDIGKPLKYTRIERVIRIKPFRVIYAFKENTLYLLKFEHRKKAYQN